MGYTVSLTDAARVELAEIKHWYGAISSETASAFLLAVDYVIDNLQLYPEAYPSVGHGYHRANLRKFPYSVFYSLNGQEISIITITHQARDPENWKKKLGH